MGVLVMRALVFGAYVRAADVWKLPSVCCKLMIKVCKCTCGHFAMYELIHRHEMYVYMLIHIDSHSQMELWGWCLGLPYVVQ